MVTIRGKDSDKFESQSKGYTWWSNLDNDLKKNSTLEPDFYKKLYEKDIEGQDMEPYKTFFIPFVYTKSNLNNINDQVKNRASSSGN